MAAQLYCTCTRTVLHMSISHNVTVGRSIMIKNILDSDSVCNYLEYVIADFC